MQLCWHLLCCTGVVRISLVDVAAMDDDAVLLLQDAFAYMQVGAAAAVVTTMCCLLAGCQRAQALSFASWCSKVDLQAAACLQQHSTLCEMVA